MRDRPLVSVVIPTYRHERFLARTLSSVLEQGVEDMEVIVLDDCSPDATPEVVRHFLNDRRVSYFRHEKNLGAKANNTLALKSGTGKYLVWLNGDDYFLPGHLAAYIDVMETHPGCALVYSPCYWVDENDRIIRLATHPGHVDFDYAGGRNEAAELLAWDNYITPSAAMFRRRDLERIDSLNPDIRAADWDLFLRLALYNGDFAFLARPTTAYRVHGEQYSHEFYASIEPVRTHLHVLDEAFRAVGRRGLSAWRNEIAALLEQRVKAYSPDDLQPLSDAFQRGCRQLSALSGTDGDEPLPPQPLVSIIVPTKDRPELLQDTLSSVNAQTYANWEVVVVNDGGADVAGLVQALDVHGRFRYLRHPQSRGLPAARNSGIRFSRGDILCYLDDDDTFRPEHLQTVVSALHEHQAGFVYTEAEYIHEEVVNGERREVGRTTPCSGIEYSRERLHVANYIPVNTWAHRRGLLDQSGLFDSGLNAFEDWDLLLRFSQQVDFIRIPQLTVEVHMRSGMPAGHMTQRERKDFPALYRKLYERYPVGSSEIEAARERQLNALEHERKSHNAEGDSHTDWLNRQRERAGTREEALQQIAETWTQCPAVHFVLKHVPGEEAALADTLDSLGAQWYSGWGLSVVSTVDCPDPVFDELDNLEWCRAEGDLQAAVADVVAGSQADWIVSVDAGDCFEPEALYSCLEQAHRNPDWQLIYTDEDWLNDEGVPHDPLFKPDFNLELLRSMPYTGHMLFARRSMIAALGGYPQLPWTEAYALTLGCFERNGENAVGHVAEVLLHRQERYQLSRDEQAVNRARHRVLEDHLQRCGVNAAVENGKLFGGYDVRYRPERPPGVEILIPVPAACSVLDELITGLVSGTQYPDFGVRLLVREGVEPDLSADNLQQVSIDRFKENENVTSAVNAAVGRTGAEYVLLVQPGLAVIQPDWLERLVGHMCRSDVAVVAPRLLSSRKEVLHGGVVLGAGRMSVGGIAHFGMPMDEPGYMGRAQVAQEVSAVTNTCMLLRAAAFDSLGGFSAELTVPLYQSIDYCLRVSAAGLKTVWTPMSSLLYLQSFDGESIADADSDIRQEAQWLHRHHMPGFAVDRNYNSSLSLVRPDYVPERQLLPGWRQSDISRARVIGFGTGSPGSWKYRVEQPLNTAHEHRKLNRMLLPFGGKEMVRLPTAAELERLAPDSFLLYNTVHDYTLEALDSYRYRSRAMLIVSEDDLMTALPPKNPFSKTLYRDIHKRIRKLIGLSDRLLVTTEPLAEAFGRYASEVRVLPNYLDGEVWGPLQSLRQVADRPRVGWAGAQQHLGDLELLKEVVEATAGEVDWIFFGMCPSFLRPFVKEVHQPVAFEDYPARLASLNLDLAVAPLEHNRFNVAKSNLRILEYGALGWPVIASDIEPYRDAPVCRVGNRPQAWINAIRERIGDMDATREEGDRLRRWVTGNWMLQQHLDEWLAALTSDAGASGRRDAERAVGE